MERGDVDAIVAVADPDVEFVNPDYALEPGTRHGPEGLRIGVGGLLDAFNDLRWDVQRIEEVGDDVVVTGLFSGRGKTSGVAFERQPFGVILTFREERLVRWVWFSDQAEALAAAGLRE
jgi:ketosteroid isomerase-like protein